MKECIYRIPVREDSRGVSQALEKAVAHVIPRVVGAAVSGKLQQQFCNGLCQSLTVMDIGPVECRQPNHSEKTCPDILFTENK